MSIHITRKIDYAAIGAQLDCAEPADCLEFAKTYYQCTDQAMADLATYARLLASAKRARLRDDIESATVFEANAECHYRHEIKAEDKW